jgi:bifunctional N-acetylglucosamine-1-phosphate-uridyltransferase/glucosamine-1-phosphate-acetyltransferase GlmU-like protein
MSGSVLVKAEGEFRQLKFPHQVLDITEYLLNQLVKDKSLVDKTAKIFPGATVTRSYIGPNVVVGNNALVRDSIVEAGSEIGFGTEVARSYVGPKSFCHTNYIGDSVVEGETNFGAGAVLANFRFDHKPIANTGRTKFGAVIGKGAQVGVNASLMPGSAVAAGGRVGPGAVWK